MKVPTTSSHSGLLPKCLAKSGGLSKLSQIGQAAPQTEGTGSSYRWAVHRTWLAQIPKSEKSHHVWKGTRDKCVIRESLSGLSETMNEEVRGS